MNGLNKTDRELLSQLRSKIQTVSGLQSQDDLTQKDFDFLIYYIQQKTGQNLSLSTIKRIWRGDFQRLPHISTLNLLSQLAFNRDWLILKKEYLENHQTELPDVEVQDEVGGAEPVRTQGSGLIVPVTLVAIAILAVVVASFVYRGTRSEESSERQVTFSAKETADAQVPNTVIFSYDIRSLEGDHFFIQQSWDETKKIEISKDNTKQTDIYYEPGYHYAKLLANEKIIKEIPVHVRFNDWFARLRYPGGKVTRIEERGLSRTEFLGISKDYLSTNPGEFTNDYSLGYMLSKDFDTSADAFSFTSSFKFDSVFAPACPVMNLLIKGDKEYIFLSIGKKGCESNLNFRCSDTFISGKTNDLSKFGTAVFSWQALQVNVGKKKIKVILNNKIILDTGYTKDLGSIKELDFFFNGVGSIDDVKLESAGGGLALNEQF